MSQIERTLRMRAPRCVVPGGNIIRRATHVLDQLEDPRHAPVESWLNASGRPAVLMRFAGSTPNVCG